MSIDNAVAVIMNGSERIQTTYGTKTFAGIKDLISRETAAPDLLIGCKSLLAFINEYVPLQIVNNHPCTIGVAANAIAKAEAANE